MMTMPDGGSVTHPQASLPSGPITDVDPYNAENPPKVESLDPKTKAGLGLAQIVLTLIAAATLLFFATAIFEESEDYGTYMRPADKVMTELAHQASNSNTGNLADFQKSIELSRSLLQESETEHRDTRDFILKIGQLVLLTLFLPILTAILGYIFGTQQAAK